MKNIVLLLGLLFCVIFATAQETTESNSALLNNENKVENYINVKLYPNPSKGQFYVNMDSDNPYDVIVYAMNGMIIYSQKGIEQKKHKVVLENSIAKGFYQVVFRQGKNAIVKKLIIN